MSKRVLSLGFTALAVQLQEAASDLSASDTATRLRDALSDSYRGSGTWAYYIDHFGDGAQGDVIYSCGGDTCRAPYEISGVGEAAAKCAIDFTAKEDVVPRTIYEVEADEDAHYAAMEEAFRAGKLYTGLPLYERFISKTERNGMDAADFAGKGKSYPIRTQEDVTAAMHALGRAGSDNFSTQKIRANIIAIAKRKGLKLPKSVEASESRVPRETTGLKLIETTDFAADDLSLQESIASGVEREIKIIKPGAGSTAWYTESALRGSGPKVFKAGTQMFINHATRAEESERPEGDWHKLVGALTTDAEYRENGTKGPGLYAKAKFVSDVAPAIIEKAAFSGLSIRANGRQALEAGRPVSKDGLPVLSEFTGCESIDIVTRAGAGGMILTESARTPNPTNEGATEMNEADIKRLIEAETQPLRERALRGDALVIGHRVLAEIALAPLAKTRVIESCLSAIPITEGKVDEKKFSDLVIAGAKRESAYLASITGGSMVRGMGASADPFAVAEDPEQLREAEARRKTLRDAERANEVALYQELGMSEAAAKRTVAKFNGEVIQ